MICVVSGVHGTRWAIPPPTAARPLCRAHGELAEHGARHDQGTSSNDRIDQPTTAAASRFIDTRFGRLHLRETLGDGAPPILALHGFPDDSRIYDRLAPRLSPRRVLALDFGGFGHSDRVDYTSARSAPRRGGGRRPWTRWTCRR